MLIDTHAHVTDRRLDGVRAEILNRLGKSIAAFVEVGFDYESSVAAAELSEANARVFAAVGTHPHDAGGLTAAHLEFYREAATRLKVVAIGEIGLDYHYDGCDREAQKVAFLSQLALADEVKLPVVIHLRDAFLDMAELLAANKKLLSSGVLFHCYAGSVEGVRELVGEYDAYFSFGGVVTFKNAKKEEVLRAVPRERLLLETDCPYLTPEPFRGQLNRPEYVGYVADRVAESIGLTRAELERITTENARRFFSKMEL